MAKLILLVSSSSWASASFRVIERLGRNFRGPPRDAWLASLSDKESRGFAFWRAQGSRQDRRSNRTARGLCAAVLAGESASTYATLFLVAFVPAVISVLRVLTCIPDRPGVVHEREGVRRNWQQLSLAFKRFLLPSAVFALAAANFGFILLKAHTVGWNDQDFRTVVCAVQHHLRDCCSMGRLAG